MGNTNYQDITLKIAPLFDALSHPARLQILIHLAKYRNCPAGNIPLASQQYRNIWQN
jgi:DNA-binding transcriptional ArsR family regulator